MANITLNQGKKIALSVEAFDKTGKPAPIDGSFEWTGDDIFLAISQSEDGRSCEIGWLGAVESTLLTVTAKSTSGAMLVEILSVSTLPEILHADHLVVTIGPEMDA